MAGKPRPWPPELVEKIEACIADGWPIKQISLTHRVAQETVRARYPDYPGMSKTEGAKLGALARRTNQQLGLLK